MLPLLATGPLHWLLLAWNSFCCACVLCHFDLHYSRSHCLLTAWDWLPPYHPSAVTSGSMPLSLWQNSTRGFMYLMSSDLFHVLCYFHCYFCLRWYIYVSILFPVKMLSGQATHLLRWSTGSAGSQGIAGREQVPLDTQEGSDHIQGNSALWVFPRYSTSCSNKHSVVYQTWETLE